MFRDERARVKAERLSDEAQAILTRSEDEDRDLTTDERRSIDDRLRQIRTLREQGAIADQLTKTLGGGLGAAPEHGGGRPGDLFVQSEGYKAIADAAARASSLRPSVRLRTLPAVCRAAARLRRWMPPAVPGSFRPPGHHHNPQYAAGASCNKPH